MRAVISNYCTTMHNHATAFSVMHTMGDKLVPTAHSWTAGQHGTNHLLVSHQNVVFALSVMQALNDKLCTFGATREGQKADCIEALTGEAQCVFVGHRHGPGIPPPVVTYHACLGP